MNSPELSLVHFTLNGLQTGSLAGVERVMATQQDILKPRGIKTKVIVGETDAEDVTGWNIVVVPELRSNPEWSWKNGDFDIDEAQLSTVLYRLGDVLQNGPSVLHNTTNASRHNPYFGVAAAQYVSEHPNSVMWVHDMRNANPQQMRRFLPERSDARLVCVSHARKRVVNEFLHNMQSDLGISLPDYELLVVPNPIDRQFFAESSPIPHSLDDLAPNYEFFARQWGLSYDKDSAWKIINDKDTVKFLVPARIVRQKGIEKALAVADAYSKQSKQRTSLIVTGSPDLRKADGQIYWNEVRSTLSNIPKKSNLEILFLGGIEWPSMPWLSEQSHAMLAPFDNEGFCMPLIENALRGTPIILSNDEAMLETTDGYGLIIEQSDWIAHSDNVAARIHTYLSNCKGNQDVRALQEKAWRELHPDAVASQIMAAVGLLQ